MKKIISAILAAAMLSASATAFAKPLVHVSPWAYNDVEVFTSEGLLTSAFDDVSDYRKNITRGQFIELIVNVLLKTGNIRDWYSPVWLDGYDDIGDNWYYGLALMENIVSGDIIEKENQDIGGKVRLGHLYPDKEITREDAAVIAQKGLSRVKYGLAFRENTPQLTYSDSGSISDYAKEAVATLSEIGLTGGVGNNTFNPKGNMTIEQAITMLYRLYRMVPSVAKPDGDGIDAKTETTIQEYENGYIESKLNDTLYVKGNGNSLAFDTDIYANIYCQTASDGTVYAAAQTYSDSTDIFNVVTGKLLKSVPYNTYKVDSKYIYTKSARKGQMTFGLCGFDGNTVLEPKYSLAEIDDYMSTGSVGSGSSYRAPDGWIYYADWEDEGHLYKVDTNGENKQKISDEDCYDISYVDGWIYYHIRGDHEEKLFCMKPDGSGATRLTDGNCYSIIDSFLYDGDGNRITEDDQINNPYLFFIDDASVYNRDRQEYDYVDRKLYKLTHKNGGTQKELVTDMDVTYLYYYCDENGKNWGYFLDHIAAKNDEEGSLLYRTDGDIVECVNEDVRMREFYFMKSQDGEPLINVKGDSHIETVQEDGWSYDHIVYDSEYIADINLNYIEEFNRDKEDYDFGTDIVFVDGSDDEQTDTMLDDSLSDDKYSTYWHTSILDGEYVSEIYYTDADGNRTDIENSKNIQRARRYGDMLYFYVADDDKVTHNIVTLDMNTGEYKTLIENVSEGGMTAFSDWDINPDYFTVYDKNENIWRCDLKSGIIEEVYPNSGSERYIKPMTLTPEGKSILKISSDGIYCDIVTGVDARYAIYVPNTPSIFSYGGYEYLELRSGGIASDSLNPATLNDVTKRSFKIHGTYKLSK